MLLTLFEKFAASCNPPNFFGLPAWYRYLPDSRFKGCDIVNFELSDIPLVGLAIVDIALRVAALVAVGYIIYGGIQFIIAQGESDKVKKARQTIINAIIGLVVAILSSAIVAFVGRSIS